MKLFNHPFNAVGSTTVHVEPPIAGRIRFHEGPISDGASYVPFMCRLLWVT